MGLLFLTLAKWWSPVGHGTLFEVALLIEDDILAADSKHHPFMGKKYGSPMARLMKLPTGVGCASYDRGCSVYHTGY